MKKLTALFTILLPLFLSAQPPRGEKAEKVEALKIGFLTERLDLTPEEAKNFWPVYNKFQDELEKVRKQRRETLRKPGEDFADMSDSEIEKMVDAEIALRQSELDIFKKYHPQFKKVLPIRKVALLYKAEEDFKRKLLKMIGERRGDDRREP
jgi:hypothetical protein